VIATGHIRIVAPIARTLNATLRTSCDRATVRVVRVALLRFGFVAAALIAGPGADATSLSTAIVIVAALTGAGANRSGNPPAI
jgi:hypothetical protein